MSDSRKKMLNWGGGQDRQRRKRWKTCLHPRRTPRRHRDYRDVNRPTPASRTSSKRSRTQNAVHQLPQTTRTRSTYLSRRT